jgi:hypothetical protein
VDEPSLESLLTRLRRLQVRGGVPVATSGAADWYEVHLFPAASEPEIAAAQTFPQKPLPPDFVQFWRFTNGANLFVNESGLHGVGVASTDLLPELQLEEREIYGAAAIAGYVVFARVNGAGDFLVFELNTGRVLDGIHSEQPHEWREIAPSFKKWLDTFLRCGGRYYWIEALYEAAIDIL